MKHKLYICLVLAFISLVVAFNTIQAASLAPDDHRYVFINGHKINRSILELCIDQSVLDKCAIIRANMDPSYKPIDTRIFMPIAPAPITKYD